MIPEIAHLKDAVELAYGTSIGCERTFSEEQIVVSEKPSGVRYENDGSEHSPDD